MKVVWPACLDMSEQWQWTHFWLFIHRIGLQTTDTSQTPQGSNFETYTLLLYNNSIPSVFSALPLDPSLLVPSSIFRTFSHLHLKIRHKEQDRLLNTSSANPAKMVELTRTIRWLTADELFEYVWPFCGAGA